MTQADRRRALMGGEALGGLPGDYQRVEYISASTTGNTTPYILTGLELENIYPITITTAFYTVGQGMYNGYIVSNSTGDGNPTLAINTLGNLSLRVGNEKHNASPESGSKNNRVIRATVTIDAEGTSCDFEDDGTHYLAQTQSLPFSIPNICVFYYALNAYAKGRVYDLTITQQGAAMMRLVPCYRRSDGEIGMYDLVSGTFFVNSGSGTFTKGEDL